MITGGRVNALEYHITITCDLCNKSADFTARVKSVAVTGAKMRHGWLTGLRRDMCPRHRKLYEAGLLLQRDPRGASVIMQGLDSIRDLEAREKATADKAAGMDPDPPPQNPLGTAA